MNSSYFVDLFQYNHWANQRIWEKVLLLSEEQFTRPLSYSIGPIQVQCFHMYAVERWWFEFMQQGTLNFLDSISGPHFTLPDRPILRADWDRLNEDMLTYLRGLDEAELQRRVKPPFWEAERPEITIWQALIQVSNHSTDHRAQILAMLHSMDAETCAQDYLDYHFETRA